VQFDLQSSEYAYLLPSNLLSHIMTFLSTPGVMVNAKIVEVLLSIGRLEPTILRDNLSIVLWGLSAWILAPATPKQTVSLLIGTVDLFQTRLRASLNSSPTSP
jgi:hypothetical protein